MKAYLDEAGTAALGGGTERGIFVEPTVVDGVASDSRLFREEVFGPVLAVTTFETVAQAVALANDTPYGLAASVYTGSLRNAIRLAREIRAGVVTVNCFGEGDVTTPFGGYKESGFGGRDKSIFAHDQYTELKTIWIDVSPIARTRPSGDTGRRACRSTPAGRGGRRSRVAASPSGRSTPR